MPPTKRKAEAVANDEDDGSNSGGVTPAKKSKKEAAAEARARAKAWRDSRRLQQSGSATKTSTAATTPASSPSTPQPVNAATAAPFSTGKSSPKKTARAATSTTASPKRRRTPVKRGTITTPSSTRKGTDKTTTPSSQQEQPAKKSRRNIATDFHFDESAVVEQQQLQQRLQTTTQKRHETPKPNTDTNDDEELLPLSDRKKKQQEGKARIDELRKKRMQGGLKVTSPIIDDPIMAMAEPMEGEEETTTSTTKTLIVTPGRVGLTLNVNKTRGGAKITQIDPTCRFRGQIDVGDVILSIDGRKITSVDDMKINANKVRKFQIVPAKEKAVTTSGVDPPPSPAAAATNTTAVDPPTLSHTVTTAKRKMPATVANIFSQPTSSNIHNKAHRPDASATYDPSQPFPTQGYKMSTAAYCGCGPTPSNKNRGTDLNSKVARSGSGTLQQLRESMRNLPAVKRASLADDDDDQKMLVRPSPPGKIGSALVNDAKTQTAAEATPEENNKNDDGILKASISRAQQLVSLVAFANRQRRGKLGIKSDSNTTVAASPVTESSTKTSIPPPPSVDPPSSVPLIASKVADKRVEESTLHEAYEEEAPRVSFFRKIIQGIYTLLKWASIIPLAIWMMYVLSSLRGDASLDRVDSTATTDNVVSPMCFMDYPNDFYFSGENVTGDDGCGGNYMQCPQWGRCHGGILRDCNDAGGEWQGLVRFVPNEAGTSCVASDGALMIVAVVQDALVNMTVAQSCHSSHMITDPASVLLKEQEPYPLFSLDVVSWRVNEAATIDITISANLLLWLQPIFDAAFVTFGQLPGTDGPPNAIGLSSEVPEHKLPVPFTCQMKFMFMELFGWLLKFLYRTIVLLTKHSWQYIYAHPKSSPVVLVIVVGAVSIRRKTKHRAKVREIFDIVKEEAYDRLAHCDGSGYAALHLRDDVGHAMYPSNVRERLFMYNYVWPRVIVEARADNRVRKFKKVADGKQLEHWDLNTNSKRGWQLRKTPNKTPSKTNENESIASAKRDP
jgi:hypothetical protein